MLILVRTDLRTLLKFPEVGDLNAELMIGTVTGVGWSPLDAAMEALEIADLTYNLTAVLRELAPDTGCYLNEVSFVRLQRFSQQYTN
jgi:hypothetical protein